MSFLGRAVGFPLLVRLGRIKRAKGATGSQLGVQIRVVYPRARVDPYLNLLKPNQKLG